MTVYPAAGPQPQFFSATRSVTQSDNKTAVKQETAGGDASAAPEAANRKPRDSNNDGRSAVRQNLSSREQQAVKELAARDREVKAHEAAHQAAGGGLTGPASFSYTTGPDGKRYATGGEVSIDTAKVSGDPQATLIKANRIRSAALAPAEPSGQDQRVAAQAAHMAADARAEMAKQQRGGNTGGGNTGDGNTDGNDPRALAADRFDHQPLYDNNASVSNANSSGNVLDYMV